VPRFAKKLRQLQPSVAHPEASDLAPEEAAEIYALAEPPGDVGAPGD
jgi:hypothetical protein